MKDMNCFRCALILLFLHLHFGLLTAQLADDDSIPLQIIACGPKLAELSVNLPESTEETYHIWYSEEGRPFQLGPLVPTTISDTGAQTVTIDIEPWRVYQFRALPTSADAPELFGMASRGQQACRSAPALPEVNPNNVCIVQSQEGALNIKWDEVPLELQNGPNFRYFVQYRKLRQKDEDHHPTLETYDNEFYIHVRGQPYSEVEVKVWTGNYEGDSAAPPTTVTGHTGEGQPVVVPRGLRMLSILNDTTALFAWDAVDERAEGINGFFRGYQVKFRRRWVGDTDEVRTQDIILEDFPPEECSGRLRTRKRGLNRPWSPTVIAPVSGLWPNAMLEVSVAVLNINHKSRWSEPIIISTTTVSGSIIDLKVIEKGSSHLVVSWDLYGGDSITGFSVEWQKVGRRHGRTESIIVDSTKRQYKILGLSSSATYEISLYPVSGEERGLKQSVQGKTWSWTEEIDDVRILEKESGQGWFNVSFLSSVLDRPHNPGAYFNFTLRTVSAGREQYPVLTLDPQSNDLWFYMDRIPSGNYNFFIYAVAENENGIKTDTFNSHQFLHIL